MKKKSKTKRKRKVTMMKKSQAKRRYSQTSKRMAMFPTSQVLIKGLQVYPRACGRKSISANLESMTRKNVARRQNRSVKPNKVEVSPQPELL